jgi:hypothetical protein
MAKAEAVAAEAAAAELEAAESENSVAELAPMMPMAPLSAAQRRGSMGRRRSTLIGSSNLSLIAGDKNRRTSGLFLIQVPIVSSVFVSSIHFCSVLLAEQNSMAAAAAAATAANRRKSVAATNRRKSVLDSRLLLAVEMEEDEENENSGLQLNIEIWYRNSAELENCLKTDEDTRKTSARDSDEADQAPIPSLEALLDLRRQRIREQARRGGPAAAAQTQSAAGKPRRQNNMLGAQVLLQLLNLLI